MTAPAMIRKADVARILDTARQIAEHSREYMAESAMEPPHVRSVAASVDLAHAIAERTKRPVDFPGGTIWPMGQVPS